MTTTDGDEDQAQTPATPVTNADAMATTPSEPAAPPPDPRREALRKYAGLLLQHKELDARVRASRFELIEIRKTFDKTEDDLKALQSMGQIIGEVLRQLDEDRFIV